MKKTEKKAEKKKTGKKKKSTKKESPFDFIPKELQKEFNKKMKLLVEEVKKDTDKAIKALLKEAKQKIHTGAELVRHDILKPVLSLKDSITGVEQEEAKSARKTKATASDDGAAPAPAKKAATRRGPVTGTTRTTGTTRGRKPAPQLTEAGPASQEQAA